MNLYKVPQSLEEVMDIEDDELRKVELEKLELKVKQTMQNVVYFIKNTDSDIDQIDKEIARLSDIKRIRKNKAASIREYIKGFMEINKIGKHEFPQFTLSLRKCPVSVEVYDEENLPSDYIVEKVEHKADKTKIKEDLKSGKEIKGARLITNKTTLNIK